MKGYPNKIPPLSPEVRAAVLKMFVTENAEEAMSDQRVADELAKQGVHISRRCVAKYRKAWRIQTVFVRKVTFCLALLLLAACCAPQTVPNRIDDERAFLGSVEERAVKIKQTCMDGGGSGTGYVLGPYKSGTIIATAAHVVDDESLGCLLKVDDVHAYVVSVDKKHDVALIWIDRFEHRPWVEMSRPYLGQRLWVFGYPYTHLTEEVELTASDGVLMSQVKGLYRVGNIIFFGSSGGGVVDRDGRLVGVVSSVITGSHFNAPAEMFIAPAQHVFDLVALL